MGRIPRDLAARCYRQADGERWAVPPDAFTTALERSASKAGVDGAALENYLAGLHLKDLALACACACGLDAAWDHFVAEFRPALYRAGLAIDPSGGRELADSLYGELFGLKERDGERQSLFRYFHGRSSLGTWLRAILAQRHVDVVRAGRRLEPLPEDETPGTLADARTQRGPEDRRLVAGLQQALTSAIQRLAPRDRLRLGWYYAEEMTLAQIGRVLHEHEATASRHLSRTRKALKADIEQQLAARGLSVAEIQASFAAAAEDPGAMDLGQMLGSDEVRKNPPLNRSESEGVS